MKHRQLIGNFEPEVSKKRGLYRKIAAILPIGIKKAIDTIQTSNPNHFWDINMDRNIEK